MTGFTFLNSLFLAYNSTTFAFIMCASIIILLFLVLQKGEQYLKFIGLIMIMGITGIFIHGNPPIHYYLPLFIPAVLLFSTSLERFSLKILSPLFALFILINCQFYFSNNWFDTSKEWFKNGLNVPYSLQVETTNAIIQNSYGQKFKLKRVGPFDYFDKNYSQNYEYLLWKGGNEPIESSALVYTIYEGVLPSDGEVLIFSKDDVSVTVSFDSAI